MLYYQGSCFGIVSLACSAIHQHHQLPTSLESVGTVGLSPVVWQSALTQMFHVPEYTVTNTVLLFNVPWEEQSVVEHGKGMAKRGSPAKAQYWQRSLQGAALSNHDYSGQQRLRSTCLRMTVYCQGQIRNVWLQSRSEKYAMVGSMMNCL
jgi:hypothetical protein